MVEILSDHGFYFDDDEILEHSGRRWELELTRKECGYSCSRHTSEIFDRKELNKLNWIAKELCIKLPEYAWCDWIASLNK